MKIPVLGLWRAAGWLGLLVTLVTSLMPPPLEASPHHADKLAHLAGYALLMAWWAQIVTQRRPRLALALFAFGLAIEWLQGFTPEREPDALDALANGSGILMGWLLAQRLPNLPERLAALFGQAGLRL